MTISPNNPATKFLVKSVAIAVALLAARGAYAAPFTPTPKPTTPEFKSTINAPSSGYEAFGWQNLPTGKFAEQEEVVPSSVDELGTAKVVGNTQSSSTISVVQTYNNIGSGNICVLNGNAPNPTSVFLSQPTSSSAGWSPAFDVNIVPSDLGSAIIEFAPAKYLLTINFTSQLAVDNYVNPVNSNDVGGIMLKCTVTQGGSSQACSGTSNFPMMIRNLNSTTLRAPLGMQAYTGYSVINIPPGADQTTPINVKIELGMLKPLSPTYNGYKGKACNSSLNVYFGPVTGEFTPDPT